MEWAALVSWVVMGVTLAAIWAWPDAGTERIRRRWQESVEENSRLKKELKAAQETIARLEKEAEARKWFESIEG